MGAKSIIDLTVWSRMAGAGSRKPDAYQRNENDEGEKGVNEKAVNINRESIEKERESGK